MDILGVDEAGRGSVLGPLVVAGILIPEKMIPVLKRMGIKDSKKLTPKKRNVLYRKLTKMFKFKEIVIPAQEIDKLRFNNVNLNEIEKNAMIKVINEFKPDKAILDAVDVKENRFQKQIKESTGIDILAKHKADEHYVEVGAASIIAKVTRDSYIKKIDKNCKSIGSVGSGYPSDPKTKKFLTNFTYDEMPDFVRKSWATVSKFK